MITQVSVQHIFLPNLLNISKINGHERTGLWVHKGFTVKLIHLPLGQSHMPKTSKILTEKISLKQTANCEMSHREFIDEQNMSLE